MNNQKPKAPKATYKNTEGLQVGWYIWRGEKYTKATMADDIDLAIQNGTAVYLNGNSFRRFRLQEKQDKINQQSAACS